VSKRKWTPEEREESERLRKSGEEARANMQAIIDRQQARRRAAEERQERRRRLLRRLFPFRRTA
jgi:hypothetical protein